MKKTLYILLIGVLILTFGGCFSTGEDTPAVKDSEPTQQNTASEPIAELQVGDARNKELKGIVIPIQAQSLEENGYHISIIGANFDKSTGDTLEDTFTVGAGLKNESSDAAMNRGMAMGFKNSSNPETAKKDAYLSLYLLFEFDESTSQRDSIIPELKITGTDNNEENVDLIYFSCEDEYVDVDYPYAAIIVKTYYDSESIELKIDSKTYHIDIGLLNR